MKKEIFIYIGIIIFISIIGAIIIIKNKSKPDEVGIVQEKMNTKLKPKIPSNLNNNFVQLGSDKIYSDSSFKIETSENDSEKCFQYCDVNPDCTGVSFLQDKEKNKFECYFGGDNSLIIPFTDLDDNEDYYSPYTFMKEDKEVQEVVVYQTQPVYYYPSYPAWYGYNYYPRYWGGRRRPYYGGGGRGGGGRGGGGRGGGGRGGGASPGFSVRSGGISGAVGGGISPRR